VSFAQKTSEVKYVIFRFNKVSEITDIKPCLQANHTLKRATPKTIALIQGSKRKNKYMGDNQGFYRKRPFKNSCSR
jgi:hypothetical protein